MNGREAQPLEIDLDRERQLRVRWADGKDCIYELPRLRQSCPCAVCRAGREQSSAGLPVVRPAAAQREMVTVADAELVGQYGIRLTWRDGHNTGIYDFALLRRLCEGVDSAERMNETEPRA
jgi:DUF971 family protein